MEDLETGQRLPTVATVMRVAIGAHRDGPGKGSARPPRQLESERTRKDRKWWSNWHRGH